MCGADRGEVEPLRGLGRVEPAAVARILHDPFRPQPERIADGQAGRRGGVGLQGMQDTVDHRGGNARPGGIVDQHIASLPQQREPQRHGVRPLRPAGADAQTARAQIFGLFGHVIGVEDNGNPVDAGVRLECGDGMVHHPLAAEGAPLLGHTAARAHTAPGGHDQGRGCHEEIVVVMAPV